MIELFSETHFKTPRIDLTMNNLFRPLICRKKINLPRGIQPAKAEPA